MVDFIALAVLAAMLGSAITYIVKAKKKGVKCIGCPAGGKCWTGRRPYTWPSAKRPAREEGADYAWQKYSHLQKLRMTKQEVKEEYKQMEGDPLVKSKIRQVRMERARRRMMENVPKADVVIVNPTHYAVALEYDMATMPAPKVTAKGVDTVALRIKSVAEENDVPIVENPPLARALFASTEIDQTIPTEHFKAVAEVINYVMQLKNQQ